MTTASVTKGKPPDSNNRQGKQPESRIVVLGDSAVGKSALVVRFLTNRFIWEYDPTLERTYKHQVMVDEEMTTMEILDTAGQYMADDCSQSDSNLRWGDGFVLVYAINDRTSFTDVAQLKQHLDQTKKTNAQCMLVGNKVDLLHERRVTSDEGEALAAEMSCAFFETSASDGGDEIAEIFLELHRDIRRQKVTDGKVRRKSSAQQVKNAINRIMNKIGNSS